jgi:hypothetical protein
MASHLEIDNNRLIKVDRRGCADKELRCGDALRVEEEGWLLWEMEEES